MSKSILCFVKGYGSGFDVIIPTSWGLPLWRTLVMWGARVGGLREERVQILESQRGNYLQYPDTDYGQAEMNRIHTSLVDKYFKLPTNKRINYIKNGIVTPFYCDWKLLTSEWCPVPNDAGFYVLRNKKNLKDLQVSMNLVWHCKSIDLFNILDCSSNKCTTVQFEYVRDATSLNPS